MSTIESAYQSLLQGVSEQVAQSRLPGQVTEQINMLSDVVTGLRRRPGSELHKTIPWLDHALDRERFMTWYGTLGTERMHLLLDCVVGRLVAIRASGGVEEVLPTSDYLTATVGSDVRFAVLDDALFICNVEKPIVAQGATVPAVNGGYARLLSGAFSTTYTVTVLWAGGSAVGTYTTPAGTATGDAALATAAAIAGGLAISLQAALHAAGEDTAVAEVVEAAVAIHGLSVPVTSVEASGAGVQSINASGTGSVRSEGLLPPRLTSAMDGFQMTVGREPTREYYKWDTAQAAWLETGAIGSVERYEQGLLRLKVDSTSDTVQAETVDFQGRFAGDDDTNPPPAFLDTCKITGIGSFQGRFVVLSGNRAALSASREPLRFFRSTVTSIPDSDPIEVGSAAASAATYEYALQYLGELALVAADHQAAIPASNAALTPRNATVVLTGQYEANTSVPPVATGRTFMFPFERGSGYFGMREVAPSPYTDTQYISIDATQHIPRFMSGEPLFVDLDTGNSVGVVGSTLDFMGMTLHKYMWDDSQKVQQSWSQLAFKYPVLRAYFSDGMLNVLSQTVLGGVTHLLITQMDLQEFRTAETAGELPFLDMYTVTTVVDRVLTLPPVVQALLVEHNLEDSLRAVVREGPLAGELVGFTPTTTPGVYTTVASFPNGDVSVGFKFVSSFVPTPPMMKDKSEAKVNTNRSTLLRYLISTNGSSEFYVEAADRGGELVSVHLGPLTWASRNLNLGKPRVAGEALTPVALRLDADSSFVRIWTDTAGELNILEIEYLLRYYQRRGRM